VRSATSLLLPLLLCSCRPAPPTDQPREPTELTVFAAASLADVMQQLSDASQAAGGPSLVINAAGTQALVAQLSTGVEADLFCSANRKYGDQLAVGGVTGPAVTLAQNQLALAATTLNQKVTRFEDLTADGIKIVRCDAAVPAGSYTDKALEALSKAGQADVAEAISARVVSQEADVHGVTSKLKTGAADAGFCYRTDLIAAGLRDVPLPEPMQVGTECTIAVVAKSAHPDAAQQFVTWLAGAEAQQILEAAGFEPPAATP